jgi:hypothetical protein
MIVYSEKFVKIITFGFARAITIYPFVLLRHKEDLKNNMLLNHERIHLTQQKEMYIIGFYVLYVYYFFKLRKYINNNTLAYRAIPFEKEAKINETNLAYLKDRKKYNWKKYRCY